MLPRSLYVLPFPLYCQPAYPALMELLKGRYEQNLGGPAFVRACVPIRWEHDDKNLSNACRSCHSMHNNLQLCGWKKKTVKQKRKRVFWRWICIRCVDSLAKLIDQYCKELFLPEKWTNIDMNTLWTSNYLLIVQTRPWFILQKERVRERENRQ